MSYKHIEASREVRLWIGQVIVPAVTGAIFIASNPASREWVKDQCNNLKSKFSKKES